MIAELTSILLAAGISGLSGAAALTGPAMYHPAQKAVSNWRLESVRYLDLAPAHTASILTGKEPARLPRCIKLNNYWCIKSARWNGEIATDNEGHVAFSSAVEGATVAVALLRRYYLEFGRKSAHAIVTRWAPAQCGYVAVPAARGKAAGKGSPTPPARADALATKGIGNTLRARYLASRRHGPARGARRPVIRSVVPDRTGPMLRAPSIAAGMGEREMAVPSMAVASLGSPGGSGGIISGSGAPMRVMSCASENARIFNYAASITQGLVKKVDDDLKLFEPDGAPAPNLTRAMANMAAVEIGPFKAGQPLIGKVVAAAIKGAQERRAIAEAETAASAKAAPVKPEPERVAR